MSPEIWQEIPAVDKGELRPIMSSLSDSQLQKQVTEELCLDESDSLFSFLNAQSWPFETGRLVVVNSLRPDAMLQRVETRLDQDDDTRWFNAADFVLSLMHQRSQGCYGGWHEGFAVRVFGQ